MKSAASKMLRAAAAVLAAGMLCACGQKTAAAIASSAAPAIASTQNGAAAAEIAQKMLDSMTLRQKVGQLFIIRPDSLDPALSAEQIDDSKAQGVTELSDSMRQTLSAYPVGGIALFGKNIVDPGQLSAFVGDLQAASDIALFTAIDEEGGRVARLANKETFTVTTYESAAAVAASGDPANAKAMGQTIGRYLGEYGINLDFAPDADVNTNPDNPVIGTRAFSSDPEVAASMVAACVQGFHDTGVITCIKHFPGHGDTDTDTHYGCATTDKTWDEMKKCEMLPFAAGMQAGADMVMAAHITAPNATADGLPVSLSKEMITGKLRGELGYSGIVITDSLAMGAITEAFSSKESALLALEAGVDILLMPEEFCDTFDAVAAALESGEISEQRLNESVYRILLTKAEQGLL